MGFSHRPPQSLALGHKQYLAVGRLAKGSQLASLASSMAVRLLRETKPCRQILHTYLDCDPLSGPSPLKGVWALGEGKAE